MLCFADIQDLLACHISEQADWLHVCKRQASCNGNIWLCMQVLYFDCPEATMEKRLTQRAETGARSDDNPETIRKRFATFKQSSMPVVVHYENKGKLHKIDASGEPNEVFVHVQKVLDMIQNEDMYSMFY